MSRQMSRQIEGRKNMARRGENIYHRKDGRWEGRYIIGRNMDGKPKFRSIYGKSYGEVKRELVLLKSKQMTSGEPMILIYGNGSMADWMDYWLDGIEKPYIRSTTYQLYKRSIDKHLKPWLGDHAVKALSSQQIQEMVDGLRDKLASSTLHGLCRLLKSILASAVKNRLLTESPFQDIRLPGFRQKQPRVLTMAEQRRMERVALETGGLEYLLCLYTGLRLGELCALKYEDIDFNAGLLYVTRSVKRVKNGESATQLVVGRPKTDSSIREIPLPLFLLKMLKERMKEKGAVQEGFVFPSTQGGAAEPRTVQKSFARLAKKADIRGAHMHTLRHTFAMRCLERGMGYKALSEILGHSSSQMTIKHYDNCTMEKKWKVMHTARLTA